MGTIGSNIYSLAINWAIRQRSTFINTPVKLSNYRFITNNRAIAELKRNKFKLVTVKQVIFFANNVYGHKISFINLFI